MADLADWGEGQYELFAPALEPAARRLVELAAPQVGERAIDLGAGTGNATLPLAEAGAQVTAVDPTLRLLGAAAARASDRGLHVSTRVGTAEQMPLPNGDADLIVSNFGIVFSDDPEAAMREVLRVLVPGGRLLYTAWLPTGPVATLGEMIREEIAVGAGAELVEADQEGAPEGPLWHLPDSLAPFIPGGSDAISTHAGEVEFSAPTARAWFEELTTYQPMWLEARRQVGDDRWHDLAERCIAVLEASSGGERFTVHSPYILVEIRPRDDR